MARTKRQRLTFAYDKEADVLYVSVGHTKHAVGELLDNGVILRRHPQTHRVVGFTIVDFVRHFGARNAQPITTPITVQLQPV
jgi:uncharacterized protein YuzE